MIRAICKEDIPAVLNWYNWYIEHSAATFETEPLTLKEFTARVEMITAKYPWIIYEEEGKAVGYAYLASFIPRAAYDWTCDLAIYLDPLERGKGYGAKLMSAILEIAEKAGYVNVVSIITKGNRASEALHEKYGFIRTGEIEEAGYKSGKWLGVSYYVKKLKAPDTDPVNPSNPEI